MEAVGAPAAEESHFQKLRQLPLLLPMPLPLPQRRIPRCPLRCCNLGNNNKCAE